MALEFFNLIILIVRKGVLTPKLISDLGKQFAVVSIRVPVGNIVDGFRCDQQTICIKSAFVAPLVSKLVDAV